ncbi:hypothetical protein D3C87_1877600 [compost metagenome]
MPNSDQVGPEIKAALLNFFMMGAAASTNVLIQGFTFPDGQPVSFSAEELMSETMTWLGQDSDEDDESAEDEESEPDSWKNWK